MGVVDRLLGNPKKIKIRDEEIEIYPLGFEYLLDIEKIRLRLRELNEKFKALKDPDEMGAEIVKNLTDEDWNRIKKVLIATLKQSFPEETEEKLELFASRYFLDLFDAVMEVNSIEDIQKKQEIMQIHQEISNRRKKVNSNENSSTSSTK